MINEPAIWRDGCLLNYATCDKDENGQPIPSKEEHLKKMNRAIALNNFIESIDVGIKNTSVTNGDVIKAMFPKAETWIEPEDNVMRFSTNDNTTLECFNLNWWNSPYRKEQE